nr:immunoglobulin heavy chain junction region [Macaca mulatta]MOW46514.1 immunoglobulin heavy chain junction region [Macaca mulatta]MOW46578.1 immunoglobulin heavy chain junction region [Macaca mulatta]MOW47264.1 immunoglobulin heavy chain junction region [Macaca mulatta]MOW47340.1 immunoglobulin heavy chain junction region [Macaca mulatta]
CVSPGCSGIFCFTHSGFHSW